MVNLTYINNKIFMLKLNASFRPQRFISKGWKPHWLKVFVWLDHQVRLMVIDWPPSCADLGEFWSSKLKHNKKFDSNWAETSMVVHWGEEEGKWVGGTMDSTEFVSRQTTKQTPPKNSKSNHTESRVATIYYLKCQVSNKKIIRHVKKQEGVTHTQEYKESVENSLRDQSVMESRIIVVLYSVFHIKFY